MDAYCADATAGLNRCIDVSTVDVTNLTVAESKFAIDALDPNPDSLIAIDVYDDRAAMDCQEAQPEVAKLLHLIGAGALVGPPEWTIYEVAATESPDM
jgi:hypothetical protein